MGGVCVVDGGDCVVMADGLWLVVVVLWRWLFFPLFFFFFGGGGGLDECGYGCG